MGIVSAPDIFQEVMNWLLADRDHAIVYIYDILIIHKEDETDNSHLEKLVAIF